MRRPRVMIPTVSLAIVAAAAFSSALFPLGGDTSGRAMAAAGGGGAAASAPAEPKFSLPRTTPSDGKPQINGPRVTSATPGRPFMFRIPATGQAPLRYSADNLPAGLTLDPATGVITGALKGPVSVASTIRVSNARGQASRQLVIVGGVHKLALTPPLGWNSWNAVGMKPTDKLIRETADAFVSTGLADHGFAYVCIDDGWEVPTPTRGLRGETGVAGTPRRDEQGNILCNAHFPEMKALGDYIHSKGLKFGIYSSPGPTTCQGFEASFGHEEQDVKSWNSWGVDYIKYDWCSYSPPGGGGRGRGRSAAGLPGLKQPYQVLRAALDKLDRDMVMSMCQYGMGNVWEWGAEDGINANLWRATGDIRDNWPNVSNIGFSQNGHEAFTGPGHWNDTDMLVVGVVGWTYETPHDSKLTQNEQLTHIGLWSILAAPMILGCDVSKLDEFTTALMCNDEVLAVDQDPLGKQGKRILSLAADDSESGNANQRPRQVWARELWDGTMAVGLFNIGEMPARVSISLGDLNTSLNMNLIGKQPVRDLWQLKDLEPGDTFSAEVPRHGMIFLKIGTPHPEAECVSAIVKLHAPTR